MRGSQDQVSLVIDGDTFADLWILARGSASPGAQALRRALTPQEVTRDCRLRIRCDQAALDFIETEAPEIAARWPVVFGDVSR